MGSRATIFLRPSTTIIDYVWVEINRAIELLKDAEVSGSQVIMAELDSLCRQIERAVDQRIVSGDRTVYIDSPNEDSEESLEDAFDTDTLRKDNALCEAWNIIRASILWITPQVERKRANKDLLAKLLLINREAARLIAKASPKTSEGAERFSSLSTTETDPICTVRVFKHGFLSQFAEEKGISIGRIPLSMAERTWSLPWFGWTKDLAEEAGRVLGDIAACCESDIHLPERSNRNPAYVTTIIKTARQLSNGEPPVDRVRRRTSQEETA